jgi:hypothetical protein
MCERTISHQKGELLRTELLNVECRIFLRWRRQRVLPVDNWYALDCYLAHVCTVLENEVTAAGL